MSDKLKRLQQELKVEKAKDKLAKDEKALKAMSEARKESKPKAKPTQATKKKEPVEPLKEYKSEWINVVQDFFQMLEANVVPIMTGVVLIYVMYILFSN